MKQVAACLLIIIVNSVYLVNWVEAFSVSVPPVRSVCKNMQPGHDNNKAQTSPAPFSVTTDGSQVRGGGTVEVTISAKNGQKFKGFYVQARDAKGSPIGTFNENTNAKTHSCGGIKSNAAHHVNSEDKTKVQVSWTAPASYKGTVQFQATVVQRFTTYWTQVKANPISIIS